MSESDGGTPRGDRLPGRQVLSLRLPRRSWPAAPGAARGQGAAGTRSRPPTAPCSWTSGRSCTCAWTPTSTASASDRHAVTRWTPVAARPLQRARPRALPPRAGVARTPETVRWVRRYSRSGRARRGLARPRGRGAALDGDRRRRWVRATGRGRRLVPDLDLDQARDRPQAPSGRGPAAPDGDADRPLVPVLARDVVVRRRARLRPAAAGRAALPGRLRDGGLAPLPRRALPVRHRRRRGARHGGGGSLGR